MIIYRMHNCILQVLVHDDCIPNALCKLEDCCNNILIVTVNMEYHIIVLIARDFVFLTSIVLEWIWFLLVSDELFAVWVSTHVNVSLEVVGFSICRPLQLSDCSCFFVLNWELGTWTHIPVDMVIILIYNCQTRTQLLEIVLYKIQSF